MPAHPMQPMVLVPAMPICYLLPATGTCSSYEHHVCDDDAPEVTTAEPKASEDYQEKRGSTDGDDEVYYHLLEAYLNPGTWHVVEEGLCVRATLIPSLATCYVETGEGDYARWGSTTGDFENILPEISYGFVRLDLKQVDARMIDVKQDTKVLNGLKIGLRELRTYPKLFGYVLFTDGTRCFLEAAWKDANKKSTKESLEDDLIRAILRRRQTPITFW